MLNQEGITLIGNVYVEGPLTEDAGGEVLKKSFYMPHMKVKFLQSPHSTKPMIGMPYTLLIDGNEVKKGMTDSTGEIEIPHQEGVQNTMKFALLMVLLILYQ